MKSSMKSLQLSSNKAQAPSRPHEAQHFYLRALALEKKHLGARLGQGPREEADPASMAWFEASSGFVSTWGIYNDLHVLNAIFIGGNDLL